MKKIIDYELTKIRKGVIIGYLDNDKYEVRTGGSIVIIQSNVALELNDSILIIQAQNKWEFVSKLGIRKDPVTIRVD